MHKQCEHQLQECIWARLLLHTAAVCGTMLLPSRGLQAPTPQHHTLLPSACIRCVVQRHRHCPALASAAAAAGGEQRPAPAAAGTATIQDEQQQQQQSQQQQQQQTPSEKLTGRWSYKMLKALPVRGWSGVREE